MARPPINDDDRRSVWIKYRASPTEAARITARCESTGLSLSAFHRTLALEGAIIQRQPIADRELMRHVSAMGNNLNQSGRALNEIALMADAIGDPALARKCLDAAEAVVEHAEVAGAALRELLDAS